MQDTGKAIWTLGPTLLNEEDRLLRELIKILEEYQAWLKQNQEARKTREEEREAQDELKLQSVGSMTLVKPFQILEVPMECRDFNRLRKAWRPKCLNRIWGAKPFAIY